jgi:hypothetical protein
MLTIDPLALESRRKEIDEQIAALQQEANDIDAVLRVADRYKLVPAKGAEYRASAAEIDAQGNVDGTPRPSGTPTNFEMLKFVLESAEKDGRDGLTASELIEAIRQRYWPGLAGQQILPSIYRFAKEGRVKKTPAGKFKRIKKLEGSDAGTSEPS